MSGGSRRTPRCSSESRHENEELRTSRDAALEDAAEQEVAAEKELAAEKQAARAAAEDAAAQMAEREGEIEQRAAEIARLQKQVAGLRVANSELNLTVEQVTSLFRRFVGALPMQGEDAGGLGAGPL
jgi:chromosome segregation ATPase